MYNAAGCGQRSWPNGLGDVLCIVQNEGTIDINCCASSFVCMLSLQIFVRDQRQAERRTGGWCSLRLFVCYVYSVYSVLFYVDIIKGGG